MKATKLLPALVASLLFAGCLASGPEDLNGIGGQAGSATGGSSGGGTGGAGNGGTPGSGGAMGTGGAGTGGAGLGGATGAGGVASGQGGGSVGGRGGSSDAGAGGLPAGSGGARPDGGMPDRAADGGGDATVRDGGGIGGAGGATYQPCPTDGSPCKILPLGDSITWGVGDEANAGYRGPLFMLAVTAQKKVTFTGSLSNGPNTVSGQTFPKRNEGRSGWTISTPNGSSGSVPGISGLIPSPAFDAGGGGMPHIILMMIGTNDTNDSTGAQMTGRLSALMDKIIAAAPNALLVVAKITPLSWATAVINPYNDAMPGLVQTRAAAGKHVVLADMNSGFNLSTMMSSDNIHPNNAGYKFMADRWYLVISSLLN